MSYNKPLPRLTNIQDEWCTTASSSCGNCGMPSTIDNDDLIKKEGGSPGFIAAVKHMCVSSAPCGWVLRKDVSYGSSNPALTADIDYCQKTDSLIFETTDDKVCNQLRDYNKNVSTFGTLTTQEYKTPKTSSHIMKLVHKDYFKNECSTRISSNIGQEQNTILHASNCISDVGNDDRGASLGIRHYIQNCNSYSMDLNPVADRSSSKHKCCSPKISGPFLLETNYKNALFAARKAANGKPPAEPIKEKIFDAPVYISLFSNIPDYTLLSDNFAYNLQNRIDCECTNLSDTPC